ncbi:keratin-associated protein 10-10 [Labeo rohita]|uniref:keratin-associated protein 10-10 n=1 Tax=Labeo rohita TaxID=84645 RepID=UPI0021E26659|nr:keratin-associated protein 10-10 [Labeo rohita]XP_050987302.1 keratin-associated protein 10-10 [Labeo rohita]
MALGEIHCTIDISKARRSSKTGFLFFLLLQMSVLSEVWTSDSTTDTATTTVTTDAMSSTMSETASQSLTTANTVSVSSSTDQSSSMATSGSSMTASQSTNSSINNATGALTGINSTDTANTSSENYNGLSCPTFGCTTNCYAQYMNTTAKSCKSSEYFCEIMKQDAGYSVSCSASCGVSCGNGTLGNCSVSCCNTTNCLNNTLLSMSNSASSTVATTKPTTTTTTIKATVPATQANNGKKCHNIKCNGATCYKTNNAAIMMCPVGQDYCMLQKTSGTPESWQAGCSTDCRKMTVCTSTTTTCYLECCNATTSASCLKLTGDVNMPSSATRGLHCPTLLTASLLLLWIVKVFT